MYTVSVSVFLNTLVQPSVPGKTLLNDTSAGERTTLWGVGCHDIEQPLWCNINRVGQGHFLWSYLRLPLISMFVECCLIGVLNWLAFGDLTCYLIDVTILLSI